MKAAKIAPYLVLALVVSLSAAGCRRNPQRTTTIPGRGAGAITDGTGKGPIDPGQRVPFDPNAGTKIVETPFDPNKPIAASEKDFDKWTPHPEEFAAQTVYFDFDKSTIRPSEIGKLEEVARRMKAQFQGKALRVEGHCDERGTEEYNRSLGDRRALSIREKLVQLGLDPEMVPTVSYGEDKPADPGRNEAAWTKNRRGELILLTPPGAN